MNADRYQAAWEHFVQLCDATEGERRRSLHELDKQDPQLGEEVRRLLARDAGFVNRNAIDPLFNPSDKIGRFEIIDKIADGGMASVFRAIQTSPRRTVALKILRPGLTSVTTLRRFEYETQILAMLQHPGIADIYEADTLETASGPCPFFAMEYINGTSIIEYAAQHGLDLRDRLRLIVRVCDAVQHAHQKGIIHRDLKPNNILVGHSQTGQPMPKVVDFGVARLTGPLRQETTFRTETGQLLGTIPYMSPEQTYGDPIRVDARTDVYAIGVLAYELLSGRLPHSTQGQSLYDVVRMIRQDRPAPLSQHGRRLRGDVETIVGKALAKEKDRRYGSASELGSDINRYLSNDPISARPPSATYQAIKFAKRHRSVVTAAVGLAAVLAISGIVVLRMYLSAEKSRLDSMAVADFLEDLFAPANIDEHGPDVLVQDILMPAAAKMSTRLSDTPLVRARIHHTLGVAFGSIGHYGEAIGHLKPAYEIRLAEYGAQDEATLQTQIALGNQYAEQGEYDESLPLLHQALRTITAHSGPAHELSIQVQTTIASAHRRNGDLEAGCAIARSALNDAKASGRPKDIVLASRAYGALLRMAGQFNVAEHVLLEAANLAPELDPFEHAGGELAVLYLDMNRFSEAERLLVPLVSHCRKRLGPRSPRTLVCISNLALCYVETNKFDLAEPLLIEVIRSHLDRFGEDYVDFDLLTARNNLGMLYSRTGRFEDAEEHYLSVIAGLEELVGRGHQHYLTGTCNLALLYVRQRRFADAEPLYLEVLGRQRGALGDDHPDVGKTLQLLASLYQHQQRYRLATSFCLAAIRIRSEALEPTNLDMIRTRITLASVLTSSCEFDQAIAAWQELSDLSREVNPQPTLPVLADHCLSPLGHCLTEEGRFAEAKSALIESLQLQHDPDRRRKAKERLTTLYEKWGLPDLADQVCIEYADLTLTPTTEQAAEQLQASIP